MKGKLILTLAVVIGSSCASHSLSRNEKDANVGRTAQQASVTPTPTPTGIVAGDMKESQRKKETPAEFSNIDFSNLSYPVSRERGSIRLKNGKYQYDDEKSSSHDSFELVDVDYADINGDGKKEAVVRLFRVSCGASCDGGSQLFYFYSIREKNLSLLTRIETGSLGYGCGLKSLIVNKQQLTLEVFKKCKLTGTTIEPTSDADDEGGGKFVAKDITRFLFRLDGRKLALEKREVFPNESEDIRNYGSTVSISDE